MCYWIRTGGSCRAVVLGSTAGAYRRWGLYTFVYTPPSVAPPCSMISEAEVECWFASEWALFYYPKIDYAVVGGCRCSSAPEKGPREFICSFGAYMTLLGWRPCWKDCEGLPRKTPFIWLLLLLLLQLLNAVLQCTGKVNAGAACITLRDSCCPGATWYPSWVISSRPSSSSSEAVVVIAAAAVKFPFGVLLPALFWSFSYFK